MRSKKKWLRGIAAVVAVFCLSLGWWLHEPKYQGRPISHWLSELNSTNQTASIPALYALLELGPEALPYLQREAASYGPEKNPQLRQVITGICRHLPASMGNAVLGRMGYLRPNFRGISTMTVLSFMREDAREAIPVLLEVMKDSNPTVRGEAASALIKIAPNDPTVLKQLFAPGKADLMNWTSYAFVEVLRDAGADSPHFMHFLLEAYPQDNPYLRFNLLSTLGTVKPLPDKSREFLRTVLRDNAMDATGAAVGLAKAGEVTDEVMEALIQAVEGKNIQAGVFRPPIEKFVAAETIAKLGHPTKQAQETMRKLLKANEAAAQAYAINYFVRCGEARSNLPPMLVGKLSPSQNSIVDVVGMFSKVEEIHLDDRKESQSLAGLLTSHDPAIRVVALQALAHLKVADKELIDRMVTLLEDEHLINQLEAMKAILKVQPDNARLHQTIKKALAEGGYVTKHETVKLIQTRPELVAKYRLELQALMKEKGERLRKVAEAALAPPKAGVKQP